MLCSRFACKTPAFLLIVLLSLSTVGPILAQGPNRGDRSERAKDGDDKPPKPKPLPTDQRLLALHRDFVIKAEKLAADYERQKDPAKARACYEEILKLVPDYPKARQALAQLIEREATADRKVLDIHSNRDWQDTGVIVVEGKPVRIVTEGSWTFNMSHKLSPTGMTIPKELRDFNLGSLIGVINGGNPKEVKPFFVGERLEFIAERSGRLMLRMYDSDVSDNVGKISVEITGTFGKDTKTAGQ